jgi:trans-aconitate 2-methyltransferase
MKKEEVTRYYDEFVKHQLEVSFNDRHLLLFRELKNLGLSSGSSILELGCGIGVMTSLMAGVAKNGFIEAVDISPESIAEAKKRIRNQEMISFVTADLKHLESSRKDFDFITLMDVLEHIPEDDHDELFMKISSLMHSGSVLFINIPTPYLLAFDKVHFPGNVQIIDQELMADQLISRAYRAELKLDFFRTIGIWTENDYQLIAFRKEMKYTGDKLDSGRNLFCKIIRRIRMWREKSVLSGNYNLNL